MSNFASVALLSAGRTLGTLLALVSAMLLSRWLSKPVYGTYQQVWLVYNILSPFFTMGLPVGIVYFAAQKDDAERKTIFINATLMLGVAGLGIGAIMFAFAGQLAAGLGRGAALQLIRLIHLFAVFPIFTVPLLFVDSFLVAIKRPREASLFGIVIHVFTYLTVIACIGSGASLYTTIVVLNCVAIVRFIVAMTIFAIWSRGIAAKPMPGFPIQLLRYSVPIGLSSILGIMLAQLGRLLITRFYGPEQYAVYVNGAVELPLVGIVTTSVMSVITPSFVRLFASHQYEEILRLWNSATRKVAILFLPLMCVLMAFGPDLIVLLFSAKYASAASVFRIYLLLLPQRITVFGSLLQAAGKVRLILYAVFATLVLNIVLSLILLPIAGIEGAAIATVASVYVLNGIQLGWCAKLLRCRWRHVFPWMFLFRLMVISAPTAGLAWLVTMALPRGLLRLGAGTLLFGAMELPLLWFLAGARAELSGYVASILKSFRKLFPAKGEDKK